MATMVTLLMGNYQLDMTLAIACDTDVADYCIIEKNMRQEGNVMCVCVRAYMCNAVHTHTCAYAKLIHIYISSSYDLVFVLHIFQEVLLRV